MNNKSKDLTNKNLCSFDQNNTEVQCPQGTAFGWIKYIN